MLWTNDNLWGVLRPSDLGRDDLGRVSLARSRIDGNAAFAAHLDLFREADVAFRRNGDTRLASLLFGLAAESLFDDLLLHLQWEQKLTPEEASALWAEGLDTRVKKMYAERLGGDWGLGGKGAIGSWSRDVAELRHRVAHGGYEPSREEAEASGESTSRLVSYLCDRLCTQSVLRRFPRTALALAGQPGLRKRRVYSNRLRALEISRDEPPWGETFGRWRDTHRRIRRDAVGVRRLPSQKDAFLLAVYRNAGLLHWCLHARATSLATRVQVGQASIPEELHRHLDYVVTHTESLMGDDPYSVAVDRSYAVRWKHVDPWVEEYHLVPRAGVMVDRSDFDRPS